jgi:hypothetical protein
LVRTSLHLEPLQQQAAAAYLEEAAPPRHQDPHSEDLAAQAPHLLLEVALGLAQAVSLVNQSQLLEEPQAAASLAVEEHRRPDLEHQPHPLVSARAQHQHLEAAPTLQMKELARCHSPNSLRRIPLPRIQPIVIKPSLQSIRTSNGRWKSCG